MAVHGTRIPHEPVSKLLRSASRAPAVLGILMYFARTLRFLRSGDAQSAFARDALRQVHLSMSLAPVEHRYVDSQSLAEGLAQSVAADLRRSLAERGHAALVVSGGTTPHKFFAALALADVDWSRVTVTLADERWVRPENARSNEHLVRQTLLVGRAAAANFVSLYADTPDPESALPEIAARVAALALPFAAVVLGLGNDGHCASLFPDGDQFAQAIDPATTAHVLPMRSPTAGEPRITLTLPMLIATQALYLLIEGADKQATLARICAAEGALARSPLRAILREASVPSNVFSCV
jgi:6-phosphogluconolactonase